MIFGNIKNKIFFFCSLLFVFSVFVNFASADQIGTLTLEVPQNFIGINKVTIKATYFSTDSSTRTVTLDLKKYSGTTGEALVETRTFSINTGNLNAQELEFTNLEQDPVGYVFFAYFGNTLETKYPASGLFKIPGTQSSPLAVSVAVKTTSSAKIDVSSIPNTENSVTMTLFKSEAGGLTLTQIGQPVNENNVNGQASHIFQGLTSGTNYRVKAQTASAYGEVDFKTEGNPPAELPVGGTSATIGGWCVENTATGTTSLCASTARWGSKEECETVNKPSKCTEVYELLAPLPFIGSEIETGGGPEGLAKYLTILFRLAIGIIGVLSVLMIVVAGMEYMTAESPFGKGEGKNRLTGAIIGLLLALASVIILQTIDPTLLNLGFDLPQAKLAVDGAVAPLKDGLPDWRACVSKKEPVGYNNGNGNCADCVTLPADITVTSGGKTVVPTLKDSLASMLSKTSGEWKITEAFPPDLKRHCHPCHYNGTCVDLALTSANNAVNIKALIEAAKSSGIGKIVFETSSKQKEQELISGGVLKENILVLPSTHITGEHFSVYK